MSQAALPWYAPQKIVAPTRWRGRELWPGDSVVPADWQEFCDLAEAGAIAGEGVVKVRTWSGR
jgi:hypothetical protein